MKVIAPRVIQFALAVVPRGVNDAHRGMGLAGLSQRSADIASRGPSERKIAVIKD